MNMPNFFICIIVFLIHCFPMCLSQWKPITERVEYQAPLSKLGLLEFTTFAIEARQNGLVYIGGRNRLFQLDASLNEIKHPIETGPVENNIVCKCNKSEADKDNINKLLIIDYKNQRIVVCGSVEQGICELRQQGNLPHILRQLDNSSISASRYHVAASGNLSTVGFIANDTFRKEFLFVGSSKTYEDERELWERSATSSFTVAKRRLPDDTFSVNMFSNEFSVNGLKYSSGIKMIDKNVADKNFRVTFIDGFSTALTGYFVVTHPSAISSSYIKEHDSTYISQMCLSDTSADIASYLELPLECEVQGIRYSRAVAARFAEVGSLLKTQLGVQSTFGNNNPFRVLFISFVRPDPSWGSALCMFTLPEIERKFVTIASDCMKKTDGNVGTVSQHVSWIPQTRTCNRGTFNVVSPACSVSNREIWNDVVRHLEGSIFTKNAVFKTDNSIITAIEIVPSQSNHTVAFMGTKDGKLLKVKIDSDVVSNQILNYEEVVLNPNVNSDFPSYSGDVSSVKQIRLGEGFENIENKRIYFLTPSSVIGLPIFNCSQYKTCSACLESFDPFCGWCTLENKCSSFDKCAMANPQRFLKSGGSCPSLTSDSPLVVTSLRSQEPIILQGHNIPLLQNRYSCTFGENIYNYRVSDIQQTANSVINFQCITPPRNNIPKFPSTEGYLTVPLKLVYNNDGSSVEIARTDFTFFNCSVYTSCISCVNTPYNCSWCLYDNKCTYQSSNICPQSNVKQTNNCPQIASSNKIYPQGISQDVTLNVQNLPERWNDFSCEIDSGLGKAPATFRGTRETSAVVCSNVMISLPTNVRSVRASLKITTIGTGPKIEIDNPKRITVEFYNCNLNSDSSCGRCLESSLAWKCGWCEQQTACTLQSQCNSGSWLEISPNTFCPNPVITEFSPQSAPFGGDSTLINLKGKNFDPNEKMLIRIGSVQCKLRGSSCCQAECIGEARDAISAPISLCISDDQMQCKAGTEYITHTKKSFSYVDPVIKSFVPTHALSNWGTTITIKGNNLNAGTQVMITVDEQPCVFQKRTNSYIECKLICEAPDRKRRDVIQDVFGMLNRPRRDLFRKGLVSVSFDNVQKLSMTGTFSFESRVEITNITPLSTFRSGGLPLYIYGYNLNLIQNPQIVLSCTHITKTFVSDCIIYNTSTLKCPSPSIIDMKLSEDIPATLFVSVMNKQCAERKVTAKQPLTYKKNPVLNDFEGEKKTKIYRGESLYITGSELCPEAMYCKYVGVRVLLQDGFKEKDCNVTRFIMDQITCEPPKLEQGAYSVVVLIGEYRKEVGLLDYNEQHTNIGTIIAIVVIVGVFIAIILICMVLRLRRRANAKDQEVRKLELELNNMESNVARVCKEAFAELQTSMDVMEQFAGGVNIPYLPYRSYLLRVLFPEPTINSEFHPLLNKNDRPDKRNAGDPTNDRVRAALMGLNRFLNNKTFLLTLIRTMENQSTFLAKDRGRVAGLILIILHDRLEYATEILEILVAELIYKNIKSNNHPKLLFRRSESIAEKMLTHWFSILLHRFVEECAGDPLYTLFRAIKQQVNKGAVDAFTNEARYSLSEDKLLRRRSIDPQDINLNVTNYFSSNERSQFTVTALSCDSISQVKQKILDVAFINVGYSQCPSLNDITLELQRGKVFLRDEDASSVIEGNWKQVNTLGHYSVKNNDIIHLLPKSSEQRAFNSSTLSSVSKVSSGMRRNGSGQRLLQTPDSSSSSLPRHKQPYQQASRSGTPTLQQEDFKLWHLVKPSDQDKSPRDGDKPNKIVTEVFLTTLLTTKGILQNFVNDLFETIFSVVQRGHDLPIAVKHFFDFLDQQALLHGITDADTVHAWKSNCLPLRFWVNLIKNPEFIFDINKTPIVDCYLSVIAQAFMDSCSTAEYKLGKDSPSNKLLYAQEIKNYQQWVKTYYFEVRNKPRLNRRDLSAFLNEESSLHCQDFNTEGALKLLYDYINKYSDALMTALDRDPEAKRQQLFNHFLNLATSMNGGQT